MTPRHALWSACGALGALLLGACAATAEGGDTTAVPPALTVADVGVLPAALPGATTTVVETTVPETTVAESTTTTEFPATGNRILMLGDSILASTSKRYSNTMCQALVPLGWQVEIEAEVSRPIDFGVDVMAARGDDDWDAGLVFLGTNYGKDENHYLKQLNKIILAFGDVPIVLVTVTEFRDEMREVNHVIDAISEVYPNISIVDWRQVTADRPDLLNVDGIHPTPEGREVLAGVVAMHLGEAPTTPGKCLDSVFTDDSAGSIDGKGNAGSSNTGSSTTTAPGTTSGTTTGTTVKPGSSTTTTVKPGSTTTTVGGSSTTTASTTATTTAPTSPPTTPTTPTTDPPAPPSSGA
ncbi:MAG: hypothetical protein U0Q03_03330 [Acidimicrobiales bacterium]